MRPTVAKKLAILADAAKYDVSCASSGSHRANTATGLGDTRGLGICHSFTPDGRCVSLLKLLLTNHCVFDCAYCVCRRSADGPRAAFTVEEVVELTLGFYKRNYIEGLFLSSGIFKDADTTSERLIRVATELRAREFNGYIHLKIIPGTSPELLDAAGAVADRLSVNLEIPTEEELRRIAPEKNHADALGPMQHVKERLTEYRAETKAPAASRRTPKRPRFAPGGQSTQLIVGATREDDRTVLTLADRLYREADLRRVYYSGYVPVSDDVRVPHADAAPILREHRLYQADWLLRRYRFGLDEVFGPRQRDLDLDLDPKAALALRTPGLFPVDVNTDPYELLLRVPGLGERSAKRIVRLRRRMTLRWGDLQRIGVVLRRAQHFLTMPGHNPRMLERDPDLVRAHLTKRGLLAAIEPQLDLFAIA